MAVRRVDSLLLNKLKKRVHFFQKREAEVRDKLRSALKKIRKLSKDYENKLAGKLRIIKSNTLSSQASTFAKIASDVENKLLKTVDSKAKSLRSAISKIEKKYLSKLAKELAKKNKTRKKLKTLKAKMKKSSLKKNKRR